MALNVPSSTTTVKTYKHDSLQRVRHQDLSEISEVSYDRDMEYAWNLLGGGDYVITGFGVTHASGRDFSIAAGAALKNGQLLRHNPSLLTASVTLDSEPGGDPRIDLVYINGTGTSNTDAASRVSLSGITRTAVSSEAVGTGNGSTTAWDLVNSGVDPHTLRVYLDGVQVGGWVYSKGTGGGSKDQIIFATAPVSEVITADYTWQSGGAESSSSLTTRTYHYPTFAVAKGTPAPSPGTPVGPAGSIPIAGIKVPGGWTGGAPTTIYSGFDEDGYPLKQFTTFTDSASADEPGYVGYYPTSGVEAGRLISPIRGMTQIVHGCRVQYVASNQIKITPGWGVLGGMSFHLHKPMTHTIDSGDVPSAGWYYVYGQLLTAGSQFLQLVFSTDPPDSLRRNSGGTPSLIYLGAVYGTASATIRSFFTHGNWVFWDDPTKTTDPTLPSNPSGPSPVQTNIDVTNWCPKTGSLISGRLEIGFDADAAGDFMEVEIFSHSTTEGATDSLQIRLKIRAPDSTYTYQKSGNGMLLVKDSSGTRYVHADIDISTPYDNNGTSGITFANFYVTGYLDDYRTMDETGAVSFY